VGSLVDYHVKGRRRVASARRRRLPYGVKIDDGQGSRFLRRRELDASSGRSMDPQGDLLLPCETRTPKLPVLLTVDQMLPHAVSRLLLFAVRTRRIVDALRIASRTTKAVFEGVESCGGDAGEGNAEGRGEAENGIVAVRCCRLCRAYCDSRRKHGHKQ